MCGSAYEPVPVRFSLEDGSSAPENPDDIRQVETRYEGGCSKGELTRLGQLQARDLGSWIRRRYVDDLKFVSGAFDPREVVARSTNYSRTRATLAGVLTGLFPSFGEDEVDVAQIAAQEERARRDKLLREEVAAGGEREVERLMEEVAVRKQEADDKAKPTSKGGEEPAQGQASVFYARPRDDAVEDLRRRRPAAAAEAPQGAPRRLRYIPAKTVLDMDEILFSNVRSCERLASLIQDMFAQHKADFAAREDVRQATAEILAILKADGERRGVVPDLGRPPKTESEAQGNRTGEQGARKENEDTSEATENEGESKAAKAAETDDATDDEKKAAQSPPAPSTPSASPVPPAAARPPPASLPVSFLELHDAMTSLAAHGKFVPPALTADRELQRKIEELAVDAFMYVVAPPGATGSHEEVLRLGSGRMLAMLMGHMNEVVQYDASKDAAGAKETAQNATLATREARPPLLRLYSGHDSTILPLLAAVGGTVDHWPRYAACVVFELWRSESTGNYRVRMLYDGEPFPIMNDGGKGVDLGTFERDVLGDLALPSSKAYADACVVHPKHTGPAGETLEARKGGVTIGSSITEED